MATSRKSPTHLLIPILAALVAIGVSAAAPAEGRPTCLGKPVTIMGTSASEHINGTGAADVIYAGHGNDVVQGKQGNDRVCGGDGDDELHGGEGVQDRISGDEGEDFLDGRRGFDRDKMDGGAGNDVILGANVLVGGAGDDRLEVVSYSGDSHTDSLSGGSGDDSLIGDGNGDHLDGGADTDSCSGAGGSGTVVNCE